MKSKLRLAAILTFVLLGLGGLATWDEWQTHHDQEVEKGKNKLINFQLSEVTELKYFSRSSEGAGHQSEEVKIDAVKNGAVWRLKTPVEALADTTTIEDLLKAISDYSFTRVVTSDRSKWGDFGLVEPERQITITCSGKNSGTFTIYLGKKAPVGYEAYYRTSASDQVLLGSQHLLVSTVKSINDFRDKSILSITEAKLKGFSYQNRGEALISVNHDREKYLILKPIEYAADSSSIRDFIGELNNLRANSFVDHPDNETIAAISNPEISFSWQEGGGEEKFLRVFEQAGKILARVEPGTQVFGITPEAKAKLKKNLLDFRDRRIFESPINDVQSIDVDGNKYRSISGSWYSDSEAGQFNEKGQFKGVVNEKPKEHAEVRALLVDLEFAKADQFLSLDDSTVKALPSAPLHRVIIAYNDPKRQTITVEFYKSPGDGNHYLVKITGGKQVFRVPGSVLGSLYPESKNPNGPDGRSADNLVPPQDDAAIPGVGSIDPSRDNQSEAGNHAG